MATLSFDRIDEKIASQKRVLINLYSQRNRLSAIFCLPNEILANIFIFCTRDYYYNGTTKCGRPLCRWLNFSFVCQHWRNVALNSPTVWSHIPMMPQRWIEEFLSRSKSVPLKICIPKDKVGDLEKTLEQMMNHVERIQELNIYLSRLTHKVISMLSSRAPLLQNLKISAESSHLDPGMPSLLFDGCTPALRTLRLSHLPSPWYSLNLSRLTTLSLCHIPSQFQQPTENFLTILSRAQNLTHLHLVDALPSSQAFTSSVAFHAHQKIYLPFLSRLHITAQFSTVIALLSCVTIPLGTKVSLGCHSEDESPPNDYTLFCSLLAQRLSVSEDPTLSHLTVRSLTIGFTALGLSLSFSTSKRDYSLPFSARRSRNTHLEVLFRSGESRTRGDHILSNICHSTPLDHVRSLYVVQPPFSSDFWKSTLKQFPALRFLKLSGGNMPELASVLYFDRYSAVDANANQIVAPALKELWLDGIVFPHENDSGVLDTGLESLNQALATRPGPSIRLEMVDCHSSDGDTLTGLHDEQQFEGFL